MSGRIDNEVRIERTTRAIDQLRQDVVKWIDSRRQKDSLRKYETPLDHLRQTLTGSLAGLRDAAARVRPEDPPGDVHATCRDHELRLMLVHRAWGWYRTKFEQRDDATLEPVLAAADEIVWSCYAEAFRNAGIARGPAPLPYVEARYAPEAIPRDDPPPDLRADANDVIVYRYLEKLAMPVLALPPFCRADPWWLVLLGHEVGHHLQYDLLPNWTLEEEFGELLFQTAVAPPAPVLDEEQAEQWRTWGREIYADACSVHAMGGWAVRAMAELERADEASMLSRRRTRYPPAIVRLDLLARLAAELGIKGDLLRGIDPASMVAGPALVDRGVDLRATATQDRRVLDKVVGAIKTWSPDGVGGFADLFAWDAAELGPYVDNWAAALLSPDKLYPDERLMAARWQAAAAMAAWAQVAAIEDRAKREQVRERVAGRALEVIAASREAGSRDPDADVVPDAQVVAAELTDLLLASRPEEGLP